MSPDSGGVGLCYSREPKSMTASDLFAFFRTDLIQSESSWKLSSTSDWLTRGTLEICGVALLGIFSCGVAVNKISACGVAVFLNLTVCDVCVLKTAVFGETKLSAVLQFPF